MTIGAEGTMACCFDLKNSKNWERISFDFIYLVLGILGVWWQTRNNFYICNALAIEIALQPTAKIGFF
jgi:hypothetical protein